MINKIPDFNIRETNLEESTEAAEPQAEDNNTGSEVAPLVQATPEYKAGLIAERRLGSQAQEMLLRNQVIDLDAPDTSLAGKSVPEIVKQTFEQIPGQLHSTLDEAKKAWSDPGKVISDAAQEAERIWSDIKAGK